MSIENKDKSEAVNAQIISMLERHGFQGWGTGGGCMAMVKSFADGTRCMITDNDAGIDNLENEMCIGLETAEGDPILCVTTKGADNIFIDDHWFNSVDYSFKR